MSFILPKPPKIPEFDFPAPVTVIDPSGLQSARRSAAEQRRRAASLIGGRESTIGTSPQGLLTKSATARTSLLGAG